MSADHLKYGEKLWVETPLIRSTHLSSLLHCNVYLKLETLQPSQSFKYRGISHFAQHALRTHGQDVHLIIASSGNAGIAAACVSKVFKLRCTIFLPQGVSDSTIEFMRREGAEVVVTEGTYYSQALQCAKAAVEAEPKAVMVPGYDNPILWEGHASMVHEIQRQLPDGTRPDAIFCSLGGGGLAGGIIEGCKVVGWDDVPLVGVETHGSNCFYQSLSLNDGPFVGEAASRAISEGTKAEKNVEHGVSVAHLSSLPSKATSLGASSPSGAVVKKMLERKGGVRSVCIPDEMAMQAALNFAEDHKTLVELACSATIAPAYKPSVFRKLVPECAPGMKLASIVLVLCGGFKVSLAEMEEYRRIVAADVVAGGDWVITCNGETFAASKV
ncbi:tryptophan synthase beta subunit-like PLP-dependent enzyme [Trametes versicolor FP-101664 SS1]|uniref:tryptophan synthase beta subunit-like PLP-dependent enzyme n=1 Tax=Trametes versicolor (strain FP-101664) TaxID=717944 RepID=UPI00046213D6|nr:tryptophan synthase beta subunit-like PLP-dependent enzyme [Trametes versicolor FP-101664 SS1]EIW60594.1 tryptophan synthase beta subunit-like PLP-dependent enzyme [Trametes versicolor FP-101664 SS1]